MISNNYISHDKDHIYIKANIYHFLARKGLLVCRGLLSFVLSLIKLNSVSQKDYTVR